MKRGITLSASIFALAAACASQAAAESLALSQARELCFANHGVPDAVFKAAAQAGWTDPEAGNDNDPFLPAAGLGGHEFRKKMFGDHELTLNVRAQRRQTPNGTVLSNICAVLDEGVDGAALLSAARAYLKVPPSSVRGPYSYWAYKDAIEPANLIADDVSIQDAWLRHGGKIVTVFVSRQKDEAGVRYEERALEPSR